MTQSATRRILSCLVYNEPGVLSRISGILAGRGFNIDSLVVSQTDVPDLSRMTIVLNGPANVVEQARRQLEDLVPVWAVTDYSEVETIKREMLLIRVSLIPQDEQKKANGISKSDVDFQRQNISEITKLFNGKVRLLLNYEIVNLTLDSAVIELCAKPSKIDAFIGLCKPYGITEACRSGMMALAKSPVEKGKDAILEEYVEPVDHSKLPPG
jgi:acetolactate synthase-1/3 small subunit